MLVAKLPSHAGDCVAESILAITCLGVTVSYPILQAKPCTHCMCAQDHIFHTDGYKVFTDSQMSRIKYIYYINNIFKD
jgi:hypothetical protein